MSGMGLYTEAESGGTVIVLYLAITEHTLSTHSLSDRYKRESASHQYTGPTTTRLW